MKTIISAFASALWRPQFPGVNSILPSMRRESSPIWQANHVCLLDSLPERMLGACCTFFKMERTKKGKEKHFKVTQTANNRIDCTETSPPVDEHKEVNEKSTTRRTARQNLREQSTSVWQIMSAQRLVFLWNLLGNSIVSFPHQFTTGAGKGGNILSVLSR